MATNTEIELAAAAKRTIAECDLKIVRTEDGERWELQSFVNGEFAPRARTKAELLVAAMHWLRRGLDVAQDRGRVLSVLMRHDLIADDSIVTDDETNTSEVSGLMVDALNEVHDAREILGHLAVLVAAGAFIEEEPQADKEPHTGEAKRLARPVGHRPARSRRR